jgi:hypothetical protein
MPRLSDVHRTNASHHVFRIEESHCVRENPARENPARENPARENPARENPARENPPAPDPGAGSGAGSPSPRRFAADEKDAELSVEPVDGGDTNDAVVPVASRTVTFRKGGAWQHRTRELLRLAAREGGGARSLGDLVRREERTLWNEWDCAVIMARCGPAADPTGLTCCPGLRRRATFTDGIFHGAKRHSLRLTYSGPFRSCYSQIDDALLRPGGAAALPPLILVATGAGAAFLLDVHQRLASEAAKLARPARMYYSTREPILFQFVTDILCRTKTPNVKVSAHLTSLGSARVYSEVGLDPVFVGRASLQRMVETASPGSELYFCGSSRIKGICRRLCRRAGVFMHEGHVIEGS